MINGPGRINYLQLTNLCDRGVILRWGTPLKLDGSEHDTPIARIRVCGVARNYNEWQTLVVIAEGDRRDLITLNRLDELLNPNQDGQLARITAVTRSAESIRN